MDVKNFYKFAPVLLSHPTLPDLLKLAAGNPTHEKIQQLLKMYERPDHFIVGHFINSRLTAFIGILKKDQNQGIIKHIAVLPDWRTQGIGRSLIQDILRRYSLKYLEAITDQDAIAFYQKCGFSCQPFSNIYHHRFRCLFQQ